MKVFLQTYALFATLPFVSFFLLYFLLQMLNKPKEAARKIAMYVTVVFLFTAVAAQIEILFKNTYGLVFAFIWVFVIFFTLGFLQLKLKKNLNYKKLVASTLKLCFISFSFFYILLFVIGLIQ